MRRVVPLIAVLLFSSPPAAQAKEETVKICGAAGCVRFSAPGLAGPLNSTGSAAAAPAPAPFYVVRFYSGAVRPGPPRWSYLYVPSAKAMRGNDFGRGRVRWMEAPYLRLLDTLTEGLEPYPASPTWKPHRRAPAREFELTAAICGPGSCVTAPPGQLGAFVTNGPTVAAPRPAPFYIVHIVRLDASRRAAPDVRSLGRSLWSYLYVPAAEASVRNPFGDRPVRWSSLSGFLAPRIDKLTKGLEAYPASPAWTPGPTTRGREFPATWVALAILAGTSLVVVALHLRSRARAARQARHRQTLGRA
jgi:hypothetical protein